MTWKATELTDEQVREAHRKHLEGFGLSVLATAYKTAPGTLAKAMRAIGLEPLSHAEARHRGIIRKHLEKRRMPFIEDGVCKVPLKCGRIAICDAEDIGIVSQYSWTFAVGRYASANPVYRGPQIRMHRLLCETGPGQEVDHINGDGLDNRRCNLRACATKENRRNSRPKNGRKWKGVVQKRKDSWSASIFADGKSFRLGTYPTPELAARAYDAAAKIHHGEFAWLNFK